MDIARPVPGWTRVEGIASQLSEALRHEDGTLVAAWLFGSVARGDAGPMSDVDIALLLDRAVLPAARLACAARLDGVLSAAVGAPVQIVVLNDAAPAIAWHVFREGILLRGWEESRRVGFESRTVLEYLDFLPILERYDAALFERAREGRFGA